MRRDAYTLVELLVVLGIIALLMTIVFAVFGRSRERGREAVCLNQMHQWGLAFAMYEQDNDGATPVKGKRMLPSQLGLPNNDAGFIVPYHLEHMERCPSTHWPVGLSKQMTPTISYEIPGMASDDLSEIPDEIAALGPEYPLLDCSMHNTDIDFDHQPTWAKKRILVLRWDQHLEAKTFPVHAGTFDY